MRVNAVRDCFLLVLTACGGALDATGYLKLHAFAANMTGNTVILGLNVGGRHVDAVWPPVVALPAFALGAFAGAILGGEADEDDPWPAQALRAFLLEVLFLVALAWGWNHLALPAEQQKLVLLGLAAVAMGIQSGIVHDVHHHGASTTYMTGTIARTFEYIADTLRFGFKGGWVLNGLTWIVYVCAAVLVGALDARGANLQTVLWIVVAVVFVTGLVARPVVLAVKREQPPERPPVPAASDREARDQARSPHAQ